METIQIVAVSNDSYVKHTAVMFHSILENNQSNSNIQFHIIGNISTENQQKVNNSVNRFGVTVRFFSVDQTIFNGFKLYSYFKQECYYRLLIPDLLDKEINKVIYLDSDIIVRHDIIGLWKIDISNYFLAAVQDVGRCANKIRKRALSIPLHVGYFNSGVMVLNLQKWRENHTAGQVINFAKYNPAKLKSIDQDALNAILFDKWLKLHRKWNYNTAYINRRKRERNPAIIHFTGPNKPWKNGRHPLRREYYKYSRGTQWET